MKLTDSFNARIVPAGASIGTWTAPDGWALRTFAWPSDGGRGTLLFQGGRGDVFEKYYEAFDHWHRAGWSIRSFDWRGQGGSGRLASNPLTGHATDFAPYVDDLEAFCTEHAPAVIVAHSMGGHLVLRALVERRIAPSAVALVAPMLGLRSTPFSPRVAGKLAEFMTRMGAPDRPAWKTNERPSRPGASRQALLTHDAKRYEDELWWKREKPELALGPPSWQWLATAYASTLAMEGAGVLEAVTTPVLLIGTDADGLVDPRAIRRAAVRLPRATLRVFGAEAAHEILREADPVRNAALADIDAFLADHCR